MAMSTMTEPAFIALTVSAVISFGAAAPGISTEAITRSARRHSVSIASLVENTVRTPAQHLRIAVDDGHRRAHSRADQGRVAAGDAAAEDDDVRRWNAGNAAEQHPAAAVFRFQATRADMRRHAARDFRHRRQQRERALG